MVVDWLAGDEMNSFPLLRSGDLTSYEDILRPLRDEIWLAHAPFGLIIGRSCYKSPWSFAVSIIRRMPDSVL